MNTKDPKREMAKALAEAIIQGWQPVMVHGKPIPLFHNPRKPQMGKKGISDLAEMYKPKDNEDLRS